jgi:glucose/arabinose dehydrogenase
MIIAPVTAGGTNYLFYAAGDMGSGQFANRMRPQNAQNPDSYEGKILRFNLEPVSGSWIPADNPYSTTSAVYSIGIRNNQGLHTIQLQTLCMVHRMVRIATMK